MLERRILKKRLLPKERKYVINRKDIDIDLDIDYIIPSPDGNVRNAEENRRIPYVKEVVIARIRTD